MRYSSIYHFKIFTNIIAVEILDLELENSLHTVVAYVADIPAALMVPLALEAVLGLLVVAVADELVFGLDCMGLMVVPEADHVQAILLNLFVF